MPPEDAESPGGSGGSCVPDRPTLRDVRLYRRAIEDEWDVPRQHRPAIIQTLVNVVDEDYLHGGGGVLAQPNHRERIAAALALIAATRANLQRARFEFGADLATARHALDVAKFERDAESPDDAAGDIIVEMHRDALALEAGLDPDERERDRPAGGDQGGAGPLPG